MTNAVSTRAATDAEEFHSFSIFNKVRGKDVRCMQRRPVCHMTIMVARWWLVLQELGCWQLSCTVFVQNCSKKISRKSWINPKLIKHNSYQSNTWFLKTAVIIKGHWDCSRQQFSRHWGLSKHFSGKHLNFYLVIMLAFCYLFSVCCT